MREAGRRARTRMRRNTVANRCDQMITFTYLDACHDRDQFVADMHAFWIDLRTALGAAPRSYYGYPNGTRATDCTLTPPSRTTSLGSSSRPYGRADVGHRQSPQLGIYAPATKS